MLQHSKSFSVKRINVREKHDEGSDSNEIETMSMQISMNLQCRKLRNEITEMQKAHSKEIKKLFEKLDKINPKNKKSETKNKQKSPQNTQNTDEEKEETGAATAEKQLTITINVQENIQNAYLLLKYRKFDEDSLPKKHYHQNLIKSFRVVTYITLFFQLTALFLLCRIIMIKSGVIYFNNTSGGSHKPKGEHYAIFMFPFLLFGMFAAMKEAQATGVDFWCLIAHCKDGSAVEMRRLKTAEYYLGYCGSIIYFSVLTWYTHIGAWPDILDAILNLLAFQFILAVDEWAYEVFAKLKVMAFMAELNDNLAENGEEEIDLFQMTTTSPADYWMNDSTFKIFARKLFGVFVFCVIWQICLTNPGATE